VKKQPKKPILLTIDELEKLLQREDEIDLEILPNGEIRQKGTKKKGPKPLTLGKNLGGEYGQMI